MAPVDALSSIDELFAYSPDYLFLLDDHGAVSRLSEPLGRLLGDGARAGELLVTFVHPDDRGAFERAFAELVPGGAPVRIEGRARAADGAYQAFSCRARKAPGGAIHGSLSLAIAAVDLPGAKIEQEARILRAIQSNLPIVFWEIDKKGIFTHHAGKGLEAVGLTEGQFLGKDVFEVYAGYEVGLKPMRRALAGEVVRSFTEVHKSAWENWAIPTRDERGEVTGVIGATFDLSEAKRAERELRDKLALIERQQQVIRALGTPIIEVWDKVLTLPLQGVVDTVRAADVMDGLLTRVSQRGARFAILDLTGVEMVDTGTATHLLKLVQALRLLGAEGIITGIRPEVAQTMIMLGMNLTTVVTLGSLRDGLRYCIARMEGQKPAPAAAGSAA